MQVIDREHCQRIPPARRGLGFSSCLSRIDQCLLNVIENAEEALLSLAKTRPLLSHPSGQTIDGHSGLGLLAAYGFEVRRALFHDSPGIELGSDDLGSVP